MFTCHMTTFLLWRYALATYIIHCTCTCTCRRTLKMEDSNSEYKLTFDRDYGEVCQSLRNLSWHADRIGLGIALGLSYSTLLRMGSGDDFLNQIVAGWLKRQDNVLKHSGEPTWCVLADTLKKLGHKEIATDIQRRGDSPQHEGGSEQQQDGNPPPLSTNLSAQNNQRSGTNSSGQSYAMPFDLNQTVAPISIESATQSKQDESHTSGVCPEQPPAPKRTKLDQQSIRAQSGNQQLPCATSKELKPVATLSHQAVTTSVTTSTIPSTTPLSAPQTCHNHPMALTNTGVQDLPTESIRAEEAGGAFREHRANLLVAVTDPLILANSLYSSWIISRETLDRVKLPTLTSTEKNMEIFDGIESRIKTNPSSFSTVLDILNSDPQLHMFAGQIQQSYDQICSSRASILRQALESTNLIATRQLNRELMDIYKSLPQSCDTKFPHLPEKMFITLAVIEKESVSRANADTFTKGTLHGHADEILKKKNPIDMEAVLEPPEGQQHMKCVFIEGAPGVGKSTFALEFCRMQEKLGLYSLTLLLRLREKHVQGIKKVSDLFYQNADLQQAVTKEIVACNGKNVLFVLDGFDELPVALRCDSFLLELIQGKHLPECTVLVTSRPSATADLQFSCKRQIHKHIEILGFTHDHIQEYAESMLSDRPDVRRDFLKYISNNPAIHGMMYIPLNCAIVLEIYTKAKRTIGTPVPRTITQLYTELCLMLLRKYLVENDDLLLADHLQGRLEDIPDALREKVLKLGKLALEGALKQQITFEQLPDGCVDLGFMNVSTELYLGRKSVVSYSFLHLTLQEFLAAFYVSQLSCVEQKLLFIENLLIAEKDNSYKVDSHLDVLWRFLAGLTGFKDIGWKLVHRATRSDWYNVYHLLFVHCLLEIQNEQIIKTACDTKIVKEFRDMENIDSPRNYATLYFGSLRVQQPFTSLIVSTACTPFDCYAVGYCVAASGREWSLKLTNIGGNEIVEMFACGLHSVGEVSGYIRMLSLAKNSLTLEAITYLNKFPPQILNHISILNLHDNQLNKDALDCLAGTLSYMVNLTSLDISCNPGNPGGLEKLFQELLNSKTIDNLSIYEINLGPSDIQALSQLIQPTASLKKISVGDVNLSPECIASIMEMLFSPSSLEMLELWWITYTPKSANRLNLLENNSNLTDLRFFNCFVGMKLALPYIAKALHKNESLKSLTIIKRNMLLSDIGSNNYNSDYESDIGTDSIKVLSEMLMINSTLTELKVAASKLTRDDIFMLSDALQHNSTLEQFGLSSSDSEGIEVIDKRIVPLHDKLMAHLEALYGN